jgi:hypothetical protein
MERATPNERRNERDHADPADPIELLTSVQSWGTICSIRMPADSVTAAARSSSQRLGAANDDTTPLDRPGPWCPKPLKSYGSRAHRRFRVRQRSPDASLDDAATLRASSMRARRFAMSRNSPSFVVTTRSATRVRTIALNVSSKVRIFRDQTPQDRLGNDARPNVDLGSS